MRHYGYCLLMALVVLLLASCQSSRPAFYFGSRSAPAFAAATPDSGAAGRRPVFVGEARPTALPATPRTPADAPPPAVASAPAVRQSAGRCAGGQRYRVAARAPHAPAAARANHVRQPLARGHSAASSDSRLFLGGLLLMGIGLATGLLVGGIPGLLIGLALGIPGYLLMGRGYAGSWQSASAVGASGYFLASWSAARQVYKRFPGFRNQAATHPSDGDWSFVDTFLKVYATAALIFLLTLMLGIIFGAGVATLIGGGGLVFLLLLALVIVAELN